MKLSVLGGIAVVAIVFCLAVLWREEIFVLEQPDVNEERHHAFEPTEKMQEAINHMNEEQRPAQKAKPAIISTTVADTVVPPIKKPLKVPTKLSSAEVDEMMPDWLSKDPDSQPQASTPVAASPAMPAQVAISPATSPQVATSADTSAQAATPAAATSSSSSSLSREAVLARTLAEGKEVKGPEVMVRNCPKCPPVKVPEECGRLQPMRDSVSSASAGARRLLAKQRTAFESADRKVLATSRQTAFIPPSPSMQSSVRELMSGWSSGPACGFWTRQCVDKYMRNNTQDFQELVSKVRRGPGNVFQDRKFPAGGEKFFPNLERGELGSCAVVAVSDRMLGKRRGPEIDQHDTVFRYNGPIKDYSRDIGTKGDVFYWKQRRDEKQYGVEGQRANKFYMWKAPEKYYMFAPKKEWPQMTFQGKPMLWETGLFSTTLTRVYSQWQAEVKDTTRHGPSGGFGLALAVISSGLCERVDLYGFSSEGGGRYFKNAVVNQVHIIGLEHWVYRQAMEIGLGVCIYD